MVDQKSIFGGMMTTMGVAKKTNCDALGLPWQPSHMLIGDANDTDPVPIPTQTKLINQQYRAPLNQLRVSPTDANVLIAEVVLPPDVGGWWIRELGIEDKDGVFSAVANVAPSYKPLLEQGSGRNQVVRMHIITNGTSNVQLKIDPSVVLATREYVDSRIQERINNLDQKHSVRVATTENISLSELQTVDAEMLVSGDRVLVKNQMVAKDNGIYIAGPQVWCRSPDAALNDDVTPSLLVSVEQGATLADTQWQLVTDGQIHLGDTELHFQDVTKGYAPLNSAVLSNPTANTRPQFDKSSALATTEFVQTALGSYSGWVTYKGDITLEPNDVGRIIEITGSSATVILPDAKVVPSGSVLTLLADPSFGVTAQARSDQILTTLSGLSGPITIAPSSKAVFRRTGDASGWTLEDGDAALKYSPFFATRALASGHCKQPGGVIEQWGMGSTDAAGYVYITFPMAFPSAMHNVTPVHIGSQGVKACIVYKSVSNTGCTVRIQHPDNSAHAGWAIYWRALGS